MATRLRRSRAWLCVLLLLAAWCVPHTYAMADLSVFVSTDPVMVSGAGLVDMTLRITTTDSLSNVRVMYNNGQVTQVNSLPTNTLVNLTFSHYFNEYELGQQLYYVLIWDDSAGVTHQQNIPFVVPRQPHSGGGTIPVIAMTAQVTADKTTVKPDEEVTITYTLSNTGNTSIVGVTLIDAMLGDMGSLDVLSPSEKQTISVKKNLTQTVALDTTIVYSVPSSIGTYNEQVGDLTITLADPKLEAVLRLDQSEVAPGDNVVLSCNVRNTGSIPFKKMDIALSNGAQLEYLQTLAPDEMAVITHTLVAEQTELLQMTFTATDENDETYTFTSNELPLKVMAESERAISLKVSAKAEVTKLAAAGEVILEILVSNLGSKAVSNISITEDQIGLIGETAVLEPGDKLYKKSVYVEKTTSYIFVVTTKDENGVVVTARSEPLQIVVGSTAGDTLTATPEDGTSQITGVMNSNPAQLFMRILGYIVAIVVLIILVLVVLVVQERHMVKKRMRRIPGENEDRVAMDGANTGTGARPQTQGNRRSEPLRGELPRGQGSVSGETRQAAGTGQSRTVHDTNRVPVIREGTGRPRSNTAPPAGRPRPKAKPQAPQATPPDELNNK